MPRHRATETSYGGVFLTSEVPSSRTSRVRDWYFFTIQPAPPPHIARPEGCAALRVVLVTVAHPWDPTVVLCLGPYGGPRGRVFLMSEVPLHVSPATSRNTPTTVFNIREGRLQATGVPRSSKNNPRLGTIPRVL